MPETDVSPAHGVGVITGGSVSLPESADTYTVAEGALVPSVTARVAYSSVAVAVTASPATSALMGDTVQAWPETVVCPAYTPFT